MFNAATWLEMKVSQVGGTRHPVYVKLPRMGMDGETEAGVQPA